MTIKIPFTEKFLSVHKPFWSSDPERFPLSEGIIFLSMQRGTFESDKVKGSYFSIYTVLCNLSLWDFSVKSEKSLDE